MIAKPPDDELAALLHALLVERFAPLASPEPSNLNGPTARAGHLLVGPPVELADVVPLRPRRAA